jgi:hypothetical protein
MLMRDEFRSKGKVMFETCGRDCNDKPSLNRNCNPLKSNDVHKGASYILFQRYCCFECDDHAKHTEEEESMYVCMYRYIELGEISK